MASASFGSLKYAADAENSAVDAGLRFAVKERPVVERLEDEPLVDAVDHVASLLAGGVETEVLQDDETPEGNKVPLTAGPVAVRRLAGEKLGSPAFGCDARPLGCNRLGRFIGEVPHHLPADGRVGIEEPFDVRGPGCVIVRRICLLSQAVCAFDQKIASENSASWEHAFECCRTPPAGKRSSPRGIGRIQRMRTASETRCRNCECRSRRRTRR